MTKIIKVNRKRLSNLEKEVGSFWQKLKQVGAKDQIISEAIFFGFKSPKNQTKFIEQ